MKGRKRTPSDRKRPWGMVLLALLACYLLAYLVLSRVTAIEGVVRTDDGRTRIIFMFAPPKVEMRRDERTGKEYARVMKSDGDQLPYHIFFPLVLLDALADMRHHQCLVHGYDRGGYHFWGQGTFRAERLDSP